MDLALRQVIDRNEIHEVLTRYCRALDRLDEDMLRRCFHHDSQHDHAFVGPSARFCDFAMELLRACVATHHQIGNVSIEVNGDVAYSDCYFTAYHRLGDPAPEAFGIDAAGYDVTIGGRYIDRLERRDGEWRIAQRTGVHDWRRYDAPADRGFFELPSGQRGRRDKSDPVYASAKERTY